MKSNPENIEDSECKIIINKKDYYEILGLKNDASEDDIRKSYKKLAIKFHPDKNKSNFASDAFKKVSHAFSVLSNKDKKANYDKYGTEEDLVDTPHSRSYYANEMDPFDLFNMFFGDMNIPRGSTTGTQYIFRNGNVEYKVYSSNPRGGGTFNVNSDNETGDDEDDNNINFGNDLFNQIFNNERRNHYRKSYSTDYSRSSDQRDNSNYRTRQEMSMRNQFGFVNVLASFIQFIIFFFVAFVIVLPYVLPRIFRFR